MHFSNFVSILSKVLKNKKLPGAIAQYKMAPLSRKQEADRYFVPNRYKKGSVLVLLFPENKIIKTVLTLRQTHLTHHSGQVSFPGGKFDEADITLENTALREAREEIGVNESGIQIIGHLSELYIPVSNFMLYPYVGVVHQKPLFKKNNNEVNKLIEVNLNLLLDESIKNEKRIQLPNGKFMDVPCYNIENEIIWGATAMVMSEFVEIIKNIE